MGVTVIMTKGRGSRTGKHGSHCSNDKRGGVAGTDKHGSNCSNNKRRRGEVLGLAKMGVTVITTKGEPACGLCWVCVADVKLLKITLIQQSSMSSTI